MTDTSTMMPGVHPRDKATRLGAAHPIYGEILDFLIDEVALLDSDQHLEWLEVLTGDITYRMPMRLTLYRKDGSGFDDNNTYFDDNRLTLGMRVQRTAVIKSAFDRDPAPRIRRLVTNVVVHESDTDGEYDVTSSILLLRSRFDLTNYDMITARREDVIRRTEDGFRLAKRTIYVDQAVLDGPYFHVFL